MQLAEELLLLLTDDETGRMTVPERVLDLAVAGGALSELGAVERVRVVDEHEHVTGSLGEPVQSGRLVIDDEVEHQPDPVLDAALEGFRGMQGRKLTNVLPILGRSLYPLLHRDLEAKGVLRREAPARRSMVPRTTWVAVDSSHENEVREHIADVLLRHADPDDRARHLIGLLHAIDGLLVALPELAADEETALRTALEVRALTDVHGPCGRVLAAVDELMGH
ncbi:GOLPH3/VPS74 family protein [Arsenicicoccus dermatophilus]|uniref:GOLPH3/VPS74 family protein n=1 Tax=Arsenicicoccus dermatophilus TaxID=1076331 RepID=UPI001F4C6DBC|nr:GPP34 family phosphoprotein [Arsenicicoccus dermatophilus]MCH8614114.1 GPP34 family phosphoprotein [Arsenicicoccus dermatophilus]